MTPLSYLHSNDDLGFRAIPGASGNHGNKMETLEKTSIYFDCSVLTKLALETKCMKQQVDDWKQKVDFRIFARFLIAKKPLYAAEFFWYKCMSHANLPYDEYMIFIHWMTQLGHQSYIFAVALFVLASLVVYHFHQTNSHTSH